MQTPFDTIFAVATPRAPAARAVLRVSGAQAFAVAGALLPAPLPRARGQLETELVLDPERPDARVPALVLHFVAPRSYTGEDVVELHVLSAPMLLALLERRLQRAGARAAWPGEFTRRAFENGRLDLLQAEAVRLRIAAQTDAELRASEALGQGLDAELERRALGLHALLEAGLDFESFESLAPARSEWLPELEALAADFARRTADWSALAARFAVPRYLLLGRPNAGKTSLWNVLCRGGRAGLVSAAAGTTRDVRWGDAGGFELGDAPGRWEFDGGHAPEELALLRRELALCDGYLLVVPCAEGPIAAPPGLPPPLVLVRSQCDLAGTSDPGPGLAVSARTGAGLDVLRARLAQLGRRSASGLPQAQATFAASEALQRALAAAQAGLGEELVAAELRDAASLLPGADPGAVPERLLDRIFAAHCLGK